MMSSSAMLPTHASKQSAPNPTIGSLLPEILWSIFNLNTDIDDERPLENARHTAQVCSSWRRLMLASPGIWGRILKISELHIEKDASPWRDLVLERTESAPLFFKGSVPTSRVEWFLDLISVRWERVCALDIPQSGEDELVPSWNTDFMDAPSQCTILHLPRIGFNLKAPWVPNLRSVTLAIPFTTTRILECLANMPYLEQAKLSAWFPDILPGTTPPVGPQLISLPLLKDLHIEHYYAVAADILERITANPQCSYSLYTLEDAITSTPQRQILSGYLQRQIDLQNEHEMDVVIFISDKSITVQLYGGPEAPKFLHNHSMDLSIVPEDDIATYMSLFYCGDTAFQMVKKLELDIHVPAENHMQYIFNSVVDFLLSFPSVTTLKLSQQSLFLITKIYRPDGQLVNGQIFPLLEELVFGYSDVSLIFPVEPFLTSFLEQRRSYGRPIRRLSFGPNVEKLNLHWGFLEEFEDMNVAFELDLPDGRTILGSYLCGSGQPEELDLTEGWEERFCQGI